MTEREVSQIPWDVRITNPVLSVHQRLKVTVEAKVDGRELAKRPARGQLLMLLQFNDGAGRFYRGHGEFDLKEVNEAAKKEDFVYSQSALVIPGEYRVSVALFNTVTNEHSFTRKTLRVPPFKGDPLPASWKELPPVEVIPSEQPPDAWFLPEAKGRLNLPITTRRPVRVELLMNLPSGGQSAGTYNSVMPVLMPAFKALAQAEVASGSFNAAVLDLAKLRVTYEQKSLGALDWPKLRETLTALNPNVIDVGSLQNRGRNADFFVNQVSRRVEASEDPPLALIVLSAPEYFEFKEELHAIAPKRAPNCRVFYLRYHALRIRPFPRGIPPRPRGRGRDAEIVIPGRYGRLDIDNLASTLDPLKPRMFDVYTPEDFRKALAAILEEISRL